MTYRTKRLEIVRHKHSRNLINRQLKDHGLLDIIKYLFTRYVARFHFASSKDQLNLFARGMLKPKATQTSSGPYRYTYPAPVVTCEPINFHEN
jgi:hypothetical protein